MVSREADRRMPGGLLAEVTMGVLSQLPTCLFAQSRARTKFMAARTHRALLQGPNRKIAPFKYSNGIPKFS